MSVASSSTTRRGDAPSSMAHESYIKHIDASHSVRIIVQSVSDERNTVRHGAWRSGLCSSLCGGGDGRAGCAATCCLPWLCPCVSIAQVTTRVGMGSFGKVLFFFLILHAIRLASIAELVTAHDDEATGILNSSVFLIAASSLVASSVLFSMGVFVVRRHIRARFEIPGNVCCDVIASCLCSCCALGQLAAHVKVARTGSCCSQPDVLPAYDPSL